MISILEVLLPAVLNMLQPTAVHPALAYIDPGTGSLVLQVIVGSALAGLLATKLFWQQLKVFVGRLAGRRSRKPQAQPSRKTGGETDRRDGHADV